MTTSTGAVYTSSVAGYTGAGPTRIVDEGESRRSAPASAGRFTVCGSDLSRACVRSAFASRADRGVRRVPALAQLRRVRQATHARTGVELLRSRRAGPVAADRA